MTNEKEEDFQKGEKVKKIIQWTFDIIILTLLLFYMIHINWGIGMQKVNIEITTNCEGKITNIHGLPTNTTYNFSNVQKEIYKQIQEAKT